MKRLSLTFLVTVICQAFSGQSSAAVATVSLDWSKLQLQTVGILGGAAPTATLSFESTFFHARSAFDRFEPGGEVIAESTPGWTDSISKSSHTTTSDAVASGSSSEISSRAFSAPSFPPFCCAEAEAEVSRVAGLIIDGPGTLIISVPYSYSLMLVSDQVSLDQITIAGFVGMNTQPTTNSGYNSERTINAISSNEDPRFASGILVFGITTNTGGNATLQLRVLASSFGSVEGIPEPSVALEVIAGLGLLTVVCRRRISPIAKRLS